MTNQFRTKKPLFQSGEVLSAARLNQLFPGTSLAGRAGHNPGTIQPGVVTGYADNGNVILNLLDEWNEVTEEGFEAPVYPPGAVLSVGEFVVLYPWGGVSGSVPPVEVGITGFLGFLSE